MKRQCCIILGLHFVIMGIVSFTVNFQTLANICAPALRSNKYIFSGTMKHTIPEKMDLLWVKNKFPVSICKSDMACYEYSDVFTLTTIEQVAGDIFQYSLTIKNVSEIDEGVWSLKYLGLASLRLSEPLFSCTLSVYDISALTLSDCPEVVEEEKSVSCWCGTNNSTEGDIDLAWFDAKGDTIVSTENLISYIATRRNAGHQCRGKTSTGEKVVPVIYKPLIVAKAENIECRTDYNRSDWQIICTIDRIYPQAVCHFDIQVHDKNLQLEMNLEPDLKRIEYTHEYFDDDKLYFKSVCALTLPSLPLLSNYTIVVKANPNVTGSVSDLMYAVEKSVSGYYVLPTEGDETKSNNFTSTLFFIILCVAVAHFLLLIALFGILRIIIRRCRNSEKSKVDKYIRFRSDNIKTYLMRSELGLSSTKTNFLTEKSDQEEQSRNDRDNDFDLLGIVLKNGKRREEKRLILE